MALETATYISDLVSTNPTASDNISQGDDHIRLLKATVKASFPNVTGAMTRTHTDLNNAVTLAGSETLTNKTLTAPTITGTTILGAGNASASPVDAILAGASGSGTNIAGADIIVRAGNGTGTGGSGYISFETAAAGSSGSTANTLTERMRIDNAGNVGIGVVPSAWDIGTALQIRNSALATSNSEINVANNAFYQNPNWKYVTTAPSARYVQFQNTHVWSYAASGTAGNNITWSEAMRIDSSGNVGIGTTSPAVKLDIVTTGAGTSVFTRGEGTTNYTVERYSTDVNAPVLRTRKYRGTIASPTAVASSDFIGTLFFNGYGGTTSRDLASISSFVDTYTSDTNISSILTFSTSPSGSASPTERLRIGSSGQLGIGGANYGTSGQVLTSGGSGAAPSWTTISSGGMTLLGTITPSGLSGSLSGLTLTDYKQLCLVVDNLSMDVANSQLMLGTSTTDDVQVAAAMSSTSNGYRGFIWVDLNAGTFSANISETTTAAGTVAAAAPYAGDTPITTASTTVSVGTIASRNYDGGTIRVYGVK